VAFSFTATIFQVLSPELPFERKVYLAPALSTRFWYPAVRWLARLFPGFTFKSINLNEYSANPRSGARALLALDEFLRRWNEGEGKADGQPVLMIVAPGDELVSYRGLENLAKERRSWSIEPVSTAGSSLEKTFHHLITDSAALGQQEWDRMVALILKGLGG
jgi:hypothetical protein